MLLSVKYFFNPSPPHLCLILLFVVPLYASMMPWTHGIKNTLPASEVLFLGIAFISAIFFTIAAGEKYANESLDFHSKFISKFKSHEWSSLKENIKFVVPEKPVEDRVIEINTVLKNEISDVKLLILSPYDHIISFYVNPKSYCGHFELITNVLTTNYMNTIKRCIENSSNIKVIYDKALTTRCPLEYDGYENFGCAKKCAQKTIWCS